tara:strand:+ start:804 stop:1880 length:1077 start_codon:yes stop_codon:yes gene_type:complete
LEKLVLKNINKNYGSVVAVDDLSLSIEEGEFITLLGPSGCGKTTTLRMIGGLEDPDSGQIFIEGQDVTKLPAHQRPTNMVFQSYALFPHLTVFSNVTFGLKNLKVPIEEQQERASRMLDLVGLNGLEERRPNELSGGQQQRVALVRALINEPAVLLLDEPLGALDAKLRKAMRFELKRIQHESGVSFVFVTHDQEEAISLSDRIVLMDLGKVQQDDSPRGIFESPANQFVADFVGVGNSIEGECTEASKDSTHIKWGEGNITKLPKVTGVKAGSPANMWIRASDVRIGSAVGKNEDSWQGTIKELLYYGDQVDLVIGVAESDELRSIITADQFYEENIVIGDPVKIAWNSDRVKVFSE